MNTPSESPDTVLVECDLPDPPEKVWRALTEPHELAKWLMPQDMQVEDVDRFCFRPDGAPTKDARVDCQIIEAEPHRLLRYKWRDREDAMSPEVAEPQVVESLVTFELSPTPDGGTHLRLVHSDFTIVAHQAANAQHSIPVTSRKRTPPTMAILGTYCYRRAA
jgi:uncharacterized protein YndB with AHSA1/START domain